MLYLKNRGLTKNHFLVIISKLANKKLSKDFEFPIENSNKNDSVTRHKPSEILKLLLNRVADPERNSQIVEKRIR